MPRPSTPPLATLVLLTGLSLLSLNMALPALPAIAVDLDADYATISLAVSGYLALTAVLQLVIGPLADRIGRRPVLLVALAIFALASVGAALAEGAVLFLACRAAQAAAIAGSVLSVAIIRDTTAPERVATRLAALASAMALAPILGPMLGGGVAALAGWRSLFWIYAILGAGAWLLCLTSLRETARPAAAMGRAVDLLRSPAFLAHAGCVALSTGAFFVFLAGAPLVAADRFGLPPAALGIVIGSITTGYLAGSLTAARLGARGGPDPMVAGRVIATAGTGLGLLAWTIAPLPPEAFFAATICVGIGNGLTMPSANAGALAVRPDRAATAAGLVGAATLGCGAVLTGLGGWWVAGDAAAPRLLALMLAASAGGLALALAARRTAKEVG